MIRSVNPDLLDAMLFLADIDDPFLDDDRDRVIPEYSPLDGHGGPCVGITLPRAEDAYPLMATATTVIGPSAALKLAKAARLDAGQDAEPVLYFPGVRFDPA
ncbi:hypothetical protein GCM10023196_037440 [Actinoallomurus vinaceus]|uniref:Uncharacterized protein n=1 Tax=Actinoallomurus vinaceus TaxID=1080074 RepID=A0ABP8UAV8_9ACTN